MHGPTCIFRANLTPSSLQDAQYWRGQWTPGSQAFTVTIALSDMDLEDGAIVFWVGTHRWG
jgi:hypothetical protein